MVFGCGSHECGWRWERVPRNAGDTSAGTSESWWHECGWHREQVTFFQRRFQKVAPVSLIKDRTVPNNHLWLLGLASGNVVKCWSRDSKLSILLRYGPNSRVAIWKLRPQKVWTALMPSAYPYCIVCSCVWYLKEPFLSIWQYWLAS